MDSIRPILDAALFVEDRARSVQVVIRDHRAEYERPARDALDDLERLCERFLAFGLPATPHLNESNRQVWEWDIKRALLDLMKAAQQVVATAIESPAQPLPSATIPQESIEYQHELSRWNEGIQAFLAEAERLHTFWNKVFQLSQSIDWRVKPERVKITAEPANGTDTGEQTARAEQARAGQAEGIGAGSDPAEGEHGSATPRARGRKQLYDSHKDREIAEAWQRARDNGVLKKVFIKDLKPKHSLLELNRLLNRVRKSKFAK